ncbi:TetR/AcrR family transcriptional regulator [Rhizobium bangladeshense]|uniref:TetR/AcrR family transcriptional regulator n=1 Tax=Rhizobium bangladeshense TaxID=1138189 RepID=A0ABS7LEB1_9HYPH|nr:TetR/AcrR family transcriptional regulator [Rhizobium bangladeshense]MBX4865896.1 TetR/AcrR family transcriptional regulator [Rhizobium bangladeshense]MBX4872216.1 TetR/AcrR family transcriptional regulator [Rhizobium bangladeshense]MBX4882476.1 TetR/AcrR family transcriptional regulator [Rhizobium bangladeshense]MBX4896016.1 TetR/AcrR family transcriptional regulator [Rhizobium bangladeshense]MBX4903009.1 TetR/AcrR family transcriptional regulator [Rhizobium bangladeshense]
MSEHPVATRRRQQESTGQPRRIPRQQRGRDRFEKILAVAAELIESHGSDGLKMSEIVEKAGLSFGALYQYFPDKSSIIRTLAERFNEEGRRCVKGELAKVEDASAVQGALANIVDQYYAFFRREPVMRDIWHATHTDKLLQQVDAEDMEFHAQAFLAVLVRLWPQRERRELLAIARLTMQLLAAAVRYAVSLDEQEGAQAIALFKKMQIADIGRLLK